MYILCYTDTEERLHGGKKYMKQSNRRINILGVEKRITTSKTREGAKHTVPSTFVCYDNRRYSVMTINGESGRGNNRKLTNDRMTGEIM